MKKLSITIMVIIVGGHLCGYGQFKLAPLALSGISSIQKFTLPPVSKFKIIKTKGTNGVTVSATCLGTCTTVLPVTLLELSGYRLNNNEAILNWKTENETNSKGFSIERSEDNSVTFLPVGTMASDTSNSVEKNYKETDLNNYAGTSFYRVKQIDLDGNFTYSNTIAVTGYNLQQKISLSPNPADNYTLINCYATTNGKSIIHILSANGQKLNEIPWTLIAGGNTLNLSLAKYASGFYYVQLTWPDGNQSALKLVIK